MDLQLIAVTKTHPFSTIKTSYDIGITSIGENRLQEALQKFESFEAISGAIAPPPSGDGVQQLPKSSTP